MDSLVDRVRHRLAPTDSLRSKPLLCAVAALALVGCGGADRPALVKASGVVQLDGKPLAGATVAFQRITDAKDPYKRPSGAVTDEQGKFVVGTYTNDDGMPLGKYKVAIVKRELVDKLPANAPSETLDTLPLRWKWITPKAVSDVAKTTLTAEVTSSGLNPATFTLTSASPIEIETTGGAAPGGP